MKLLILMWELVEEFASVATEKSSLLILRRLRCGVGWKELSADGEVKGDRKLILVEDTWASSIKYVFSSRCLHFYIYIYCNQKFEGFFNCS